MGKLIVIEGSCDGVGKSTQYRMLIDRLKEEKENMIITHHFPSYGTYQGRPVEEYLKGNYGKISELSPYFVNSLYAQDRAITWVNGLKHEYDNGSIIILDRYTTSSLIYQSSVIEDKKENDSTITAKAMKELRKKYKLNIKDKTIKSDYNTYIKNATTTTTTTETSE